MKAEQIQNLILGEKNAFGDIYLNGKIALENGKKFTKFFCRELALAIENYHNKYSLVSWRRANRRNKTKNFSLRGGNKRNRKQSNFSPPRFKICSRILKQEIIKNNP